MAMWGTYGATDGLGDQLWQPYLVRGTIHSNIFYCRCSGGPILRDHLWHERLLQMNGFCGGPILAANQFFRYRPFI